MSEIEMHYGECLLWVEALHWFIEKNGLEIPTWRGMEQLGWKSTPKPTLNIG